MLLLRKLYDYPYMETLYNLRKQAVSQAFSMVWHLLDC